MPNTTETSAAAEKAYAAAAEKQAAKKVDVKAVEKAVETETTAPAKVSKVAKAVAAPAKKTAAKKTAPKKTVSKKVAAKKPAAKKAIVARKAAKPKAAKPASKPTTSIKSLKEKIMATKNTANVTETMKTTAEDMQARLKGAYEKIAEFAGEYNEFNKGNIEALVESGKVLAEGVQTLGREAVEDTRTAFETVTADVKKLAAVSSPTEMFQLQGELARTYFDQAIANASKSSEKMMKLANDAFAPVSNRVSIAVEKVSKAA